MNADDDEGKALASTAVGERSPSAQVLHDGVKQALFEGKRPPSGEYDPGTLLAGRYRVVALVGRGGMGEVYRARDLVVDEDVAIKFLPASLATRSDYLERFVQELRLARQVSHPHVCRVHDIGEADGRRFISMEYIDGEDLASLLRRIGRLGHEKALELAHQLCAGLAALHERGIIHRDLKPSNVMLDGSGRIRLADFGLASIAHELGTHEIRDGTPAYQAPEQIAGREVTVRSDVYALGLVLHEMFLGRRPDDSTRDGTTALSGLEPPVAEVLERCLDRDPRHRPASALEVSAQLPGGDPLSAALAAGRLPSPEAVANAATVGALSRRVAWALVSVTLVALLSIAVFGATRTALSNGGEVLEPEVLQHRVSEILETAGYAPTFRVGEAVRLDFNDSFIESVKREHDDPREALREHELSAIVMHVRGFPMLRSTQTTVGAHEVELTVPHETEITVDGRGRLRGLLRIPPNDLWEDEGGTTGGDDESERSAPEPLRSAVAGTPVRTYPWRRLFDEAGLDEHALTPVLPRDRPPVYADSLHAWEGTLHGVPVRVHAASMHGKPVWFSVQRSDSSPALPMRSDAMWIIGFTALAFGVLIIVTTLRNAIAALRRREGDFVGARRVAYVMFGLNVLSWALNAEGVELVDVPAWFLRAAGIALAAWLGYLILEPYARANWPRSLVSWTRVLQGRWRDPMVGRDLLVAACVAAVLAFIAPLAASLVGDDPLRADYSLDALLGVRRALGVVVEDSRDAVVRALAIYVVLLGLQSVVRRRIVALTLFVFVVPTVAIVAGGAPDGIETALIFGAQAFVMVRFGLLALVALNVVYAAAIHLPITIDGDDWWARTGLLGVVIVLVPAIYGFVRATAPQRVAAR